MQIRGKLEDRSPADLLEWLHQDKKAGVLRFWRPSSKVRKDFWLEGGEIVSSGTNDPREYLGSFLIAQGKITETDFVRAYRTQLETKVLFGKVLTMFRLVSDAEVEIALKAKTEESIWDVFLWRDGKFEYDDSVLLGGQRLPLRIDMAELVAEGERRVIEWGVIRQTFPHLHVEVELTKIAPAEGGPLERKLFTALATGKPLAEVAMDLRLSPFLLLRRMSDLLKKGNIRLLEVHPREDTEVPDSIEEKEAPPPMSDDAAAAAVLFPTGVTGQSVNAATLKNLVPVLRLPSSELVKLKFDAEQGYLISRIDGVFDVATVVSLCPFRESAALKGLSDLAARGIITLQNT
jgi:hypothetical protein